jgi:hypothetical protein
MTIIVGYLTLIKQFNNMVNNQTISKNKEKQVIIELYLLG